jgi:hypothetical protein
MTQQMWHLHTKTSQLLWRTLQTAAATVTKTAPATIHVKGLPSTPTRLLSC